MSQGKSVAQQFNAQIHPQGLRKHLQCNYLNLTNRKSLFLLSPAFFNLWHFTFRFMIEISIQLSNMQSDFCSQRNFTGAFIQKEMS